MAGLPPVPLMDLREFPQTFQDWLRQLRTLVATGVGGIVPWASVDKTGSVITDIVSRNHDSLQNISGGAAADYQHLTSNQWQHASNLGTLTSKSVAGGVDRTLSTLEAQARIIELSGLLTNNINVIVPAAVWDWIIFNNTTGAFTLTVKTSLGTGIAVGQGKRAVLYSDSANVVRATADV